jgi:superfamily I DNA/RNA helicase
MELSKEQCSAVYFDGNAYVTACPGSGKTRALTARLALGMGQLKSKSEKVLAVTYTNRAANEIKSRIEEFDVFDSKKIWAGTIHSFALEWIIRPYAGYLSTLNNGFDVADEYETRIIIASLKEEKGVGFFDGINTSFDRNGNVANKSKQHREVECEYRKHLKAIKKIDFDQALYFAYQILELKPEIAETLGTIFRLICIDEVQDTQDLQYAILSKIFKQSKIKPNLFIVGDVNQAIFEGIGGLPKDILELNFEFEGSNLIPFNFSDNYRSTQRVVDYFSSFRGTNGIVAKADYSHLAGSIQFSNQTIHKDNLATEIAGIIKSELKSGVPENEICIVAPQWAPIRALTRKLVTLLPEVHFDAPSLSPFSGQHDNFWLIVTNIVLTSPSGRLYSTRVRWANEIITRLSISFHQIGDFTAKQLLKMLNSFSTKTITGTDYLFECFDYLMAELDVDLKLDVGLHESHSLFFEKAKKNLELNEDQYKNEVEVFKRFFKESTGVVINTCHGVKGEEYETVIAFGMLKGFIPHWDVIIKQTRQEATKSESKLLYVIASRAKKNLYLIAENGRQTKSRNPYETSDMLIRYKYQYDK